MAVLVFAEASKYTNEELVGMSIEYAKKVRLTPIPLVVPSVCSPVENIKDTNWLERVNLPLSKGIDYGEPIVAQIQHKMTETSAGIVWVCCPMGYDNEQL
jgi:hypothetical protein